MLIFLVAGAVGLAIGLAVGGRLLALADVSLRAPGLVWVGLGIQVALGAEVLRSLPEGRRFALVLASYGLVGSWLVVNAVAHAGAMRTAMALLAGGWMLNVVVMVPNGGMPVSAAALEASGAPPGLDVAEGHLWKHVPESPTTSLAWLGDVVGVPSLKTVLSAGDLVMVAGIAVAFAAGVAPAGAGNHRRRLAGEICIRRRGARSVSRCGHRQLAHRRAPAP
jgi:hypothetical protein